MVEISIKDEISLISFDKFNLQLILESGGVISTSQCLSYQMSRCLIDIRFENNLKNLSHIYNIIGTTVKTIGISEDTIDIYLHNGDKLRIYADSQYMGEIGLVRFEDQFWVIRR